MISRKIVLAVCVAGLCYCAVQLGWCANIGQSSKIACRVLSETANG